MKNESPSLAVIVGSAGGIGSAVARLLCADPSVSEIVLADVDADGIQVLASELGGTGKRVSWVETDLCSESSIEQLVGATREARKVALVAGAFVAEPSLEATVESFNRILSINLVGTYALAQAYSRQMGMSGGGAICAIGSIAARMPRMRQAAYCASKAGMRQALRVLGMEVLADGVRINFVAPGPTETPMMTSLAADHSVSDLWRGSAEALRPPIPDRRVGTPEDIAAAVAFLLSDNASHIALHDLYVDGGESLGL